MRDDRSRWGVLWAAVALAALSLCPAPSTAQQNSKGLLYGFTAFPYDYSIEAERRLDSLIAANANLYAIHMDECVPWAEALADTAFPPSLEASWRKDKARISPGQAVYIAITPTSMDRQTLAPQCGAAADSKDPLPRELRGARLDDPRIKRAYVNYARRVIATFDPGFLNIGIEISELALRHPQDWPAFQDLFLHTYGELKKTSPRIRIGTEMVLQSLLVPRVAALVKPVVEAGDYLGISFYPYASSFGEFFGAPRLPPPPEQWRAALNWLRSYTTKPIAICETGYSTVAMVIREGPGLPLTGDAPLQKAFLEDLIRIAIRDEYLFIVWFVLVDYTRLLAAMPGAQEGMKIWLHAGLFTPALEPKPAWEAWQMLKQQSLVPPAFPSDAPSAAPAVTAAAPAARAAAARVPTLQCSANSTVRTTDQGPQPGMRSALWTVRYAKEWELCHTVATPAGKASGVRLWVRSDASDFVLLRVQERSGEAFFEFVPAGIDWGEIEIPFAQFKPDPSTRRDGRLQPDQIESLWLGDGAAVGGATGSRSYWIAEFGFYD